MRLEIPIRERYAPGVFLGGSGGAPLVGAPTVDGGGRVFCPNCGTQNPDTTQTCQKCGFNVKGAAAPKFKGTMLMMNQQLPPQPGAAGGTAPPPGSPPSGAPGSPPSGAPNPGAPIPTGAPRPSPLGGGAMPSKLKGTMVGVAPMMAGSAPAPAPSANPPGFDPPAPPQDFNAPPASPGGGPYGAPPGGDPNAVNPLGGTMVAEQAPFGGPPGQPFGAPPPQQPGGFGAPPPHDPSGGGYGSPPGAPGGYGAPPPGGAYGPPPGGAYGAPPQPAPAQDFASQVNQGFNQAADALNQGFNQVAGYGPPPGGAYGAQGSQALAPMGGYGQGGPMVPGQPGVHGPKGQVRNPINVLLIGLVTCGLYQMIWFIQLCGEMSTFLQRDEPSWLKIVGLSVVTCGIYGLYWQLTRLPALVQEVQQRAGVPNPQNHGSCTWSRTTT